MVDASDLGAIHEDVYVVGGGGTFDNVGAKALMDALNEMAGAIRSQRSTRQAAFEGALVSWHGAARDQFGERHAVGMGDAEQLIGALEAAAQTVQQMMTAAWTEQQRIEAARKWVADYEAHERSESLMNKISDWGIFGGEDFDPPPKPPGPTPPPDLAAPAPGLTRQV
jgi:hypothetical protein